MTPTTVAESQILQCCKSGGEIDCSALETAQQAVRGSLLAEAIVNATHARLVTIVGARVHGACDLEGQDVKLLLRFRRCSFDKPLVLTDATIPTLSFQDCQLGGLEAEHVTVDGTMRLAGTMVTGNLRLPHAIIHGDVDLAGSTIGVQGNPDHASLDATSMRLDGSLRCTSGFLSHGGLRLVRAEIRGNLDFYDSQRPGPSSVAWVRLVRCTIGGELDLRHLTITSARNGESLSAQGVRVSGTFFLRLMSTPAQKLNLQRAHVGELNDGANSYPRDVALAGFVFDAFDRFSSVGNVNTWPPISVPERIAILSRSRPFSVQPFEQVAKVLRAEGDELAATTVIIAKHRARRRYGNLKLIARMVNGVLDVTVGFGYRAWRIGLLACAVVVVGAFVFASVPPQAVKESPLAFRPLVYSLDAFLPAVNLHQEDAFVATGSTEYYYAAHVLSGWLLAALLLTGVNNVIRRS